jgi:hypothetical protein
VRIAGDVDQRFVSAGIIMAGADKVMHPKLAHVAERHRRAEELNDASSETVLTFVHTGIEAN